MGNPAGRCPDWENHGSFVSLGSDDAAKYVEVKKAILHQYDVNDETHRRRFSQDRKKPEESYCNWGDRLHDHFRWWTKDQEMSLMIMDQFIHGVPEDLRIWLRERKPKNMQGAMGMVETIPWQGMEARPCRTNLFPVQVEECQMRADWKGGQLILCR